MTWHRIQYLKHKHVYITCVNFSLKSIHAVGEIPTYLIYRAGILFSPNNLFSYLLTSENEHPLRVSD